MLRLMRVCRLPQASELQARLRETEEQLTRTLQEAADAGAAKRALSEELAAEKTKVSHPYEW